MEQGTAHRIRTLKAHLLRLLEGNISESELSELVQISRLIAESYLRHFRPAAAKLCSAMGLTVTDLAYDCIADVFARDDNDHFPHMENFASSLRGDPDALPDSHIFLAFKSFITKVADAGLARLYVQNDPAGAKIHRNLRDCLKHSSLFSVERGFRGIVLTPKTAETLNHLDTFPLEILERQFLVRVGQHRAIPHLLGVLNEVLLEQSTYRRSIPLIDVVQMLKKIFRSESEIYTQEYVPQVDGLAEFEIEQLRVDVELALKEKILFTYLVRGKIDRKQAEAMYGAFHDLLWDWCYAGESDSSLYKHLEKRFPLDKDEYERTLGPEDGISA